MWPRWRFPTDRSTWWSARCRCTTGPTRPQGWSRSAACCAPAAGRWSGTSGPASGRIRSDHAARVRPPRSSKRVVPPFGWSARRHGAGPGSSSSPSGSSWPATRNANDRHLGTPSKHFGSVRAVEDLTFEVPAGKVTGFLGPNGAGKTTTLRMLLGLVAPTNGQLLIGGRRYQDLPSPRRVVGAVLEATGFHPGRRGRDHLRILAQVAGVATSRVEEVLEQVGLAAGGGRRVGGYSMGVRQRLGLAGALLGDPEVLILDEPGNGLDPGGRAWLRAMLQQFAAQGRTVLVSSHVLSEVAQTVDQVVIISGGWLRFAGPIRELGEQRVTITTPEPVRLRSVLRGRGYQVDVIDASALEAHGAIAEEVGRLAACEQIPLFGLHGSGESLERAFLRLTQDPTSSPGVRAAVAGSRGAGAW